MMCVVAYHSKMSFVRVGSKTFDDIEDDLAVERLMMTEYKWEDDQTK